jgi:ubiquinone/menaquinone biosynthesis C-methylase UbiE
MLKILQTRQLSEEAMAYAPDFDLARNLQDLRFINRWTGARRKLRSMLGEYFDPSEAFRFLDVGGASGDIPANLKEHFPAVRTLVLDLNPRNLRRAAPPKLAADAFRLPLRDASCDVAHCSLFLHHFTNEQCVEILLEMYRVAKRLILIQDLHRHPIAHSFLPATRHIFRWHPLTVDDGTLSVAAGWQREELKDVLQGARMLEMSRITWHFPSFRYFIAIEKTKSH